jgi:hypothetical protein
MRDTNKYNTIYARNCATVRQLVVEQKQRYEDRQRMTFNERGAYTDQCVQNVFECFGSDGSPLNLDDLLYIAQFVTHCTGEVITLEELCDLFFANTDYFLSQGFTRENIDALNRSYQARFN